MSPVRSVTEDFRSFFSERNNAKIDMKMKQAKATDERSLGLFNRLVARRGVHVRLPYCFETYVP